MFPSFFGKDAANDANTLKTYFFGFLLSFGVFDFFFKNRVKNLVVIDDHSL